MLLLLDAYSISTLYFHPFFQSLNLFNWASHQIRAFDHFLAYTLTMDLKNVVKARELEERALDKLGDSTNTGNTESGVLLRADMIDFKTWDVQLEKHLNRAWPRNTEARTKPEDWEIDLAKLDIKNAIAHGTYGTVYRGVYDAQDVAGKLTLGSKLHFIDFILCALSWFLGVLDCDRVEFVCKI